MSNTNNPDGDKESLNFIEEMVKADIEAGRVPNVINTRFPPEPNGYLHLGHAKSICLNFGLAQQYGGITNLRFDDTNPSAEKVEYVESIKQDVQWLGFSWGDREYFASDYFDQLYDLAVKLIESGDAYVDDSTVEEIREMRTKPTEPGIESPYRNRSVEENLDLFERMKNGEFEDGARVLRAKIDMSSPNMHLRDPLMYRIKKEHHHRTGDKWCIYPMYDWAHGQSDAIEGITHSLCTLEFEVHRPLYDWFLDKLPPFNPRPYQTEFARLNLGYTVLSKRKLKQLVEGGHVSGWDDPRMPTISGARRRGYSPASIRNFASRIGVTKQNSVTDMALLEFSVREDLNKTAPRVMAVLDPVKVVVTNWPAGKVETMIVENNPEDPSAGEREVPFSGELYIEKDDFREEGNRKFFRLKLGGEVRLKGAYIIKGESCVKDPETGEVTEIHVTYDPDTKSGEDTSGKKVKGTLHWVSIAHAIPAEVRLYDRLFTENEPGSHKDVDFLEFLNPNSLEVLPQVYLEPSLSSAKPGDRFQFMRKGYFCLDPDSSGDKLIFNRTVGLRDTWAKMQK